MPLIMRLDSARKWLRIWKNMKCMLYKRQKTYLGVTGKSQSVLQNENTLKTSCLIEEALQFKYALWKLKKIWINEAKQNNRNIHWNSAGSLWCFWNSMNNKYQTFLNHEVQCKHGYTGWVKKLTPLLFKLAGEGISFFYSPCRLCFMHFRYNNDSLIDNYFGLLIFYSSRKRSVWSYFLYWVVFYIELFH